MTEPTQALGNTEDTVMEMPHTTANMPGFDLPMESYTVFNDGDAHDNVLFPYEAGGKNCNLAVARDSKSVFVRVPWIEKLPCLSPIPQLQSLLLDGISVSDLPSFAFLGCLKHLVMKNLMRLRFLPVGIAEAPRLCSLSLSSCPFLKVIDDEVWTKLGAARASPEDMSFHRLHLADLACPFPNELGRLQGLQELWMENRHALPHVHDVDRLPLQQERIINLQKLSVVSFAYIPYLSAYGNVGEILFKGMLTFFENMPTLACMVNLEKITIENSAMRHLPVAIGDAPKLREMNIVRCEQLVSISEELINRLAHKTQMDPLRFKILRIDGVRCPIPHTISKLHGLEELHLSNSKESFGEFPKIGRTLIALRVLSVSQFGHYTSLPADMSGLTSLTTLKLKGLEFQSIAPSIKDLVALRTLVFKSISFAHVPLQIGFLTNLEILKFRECASVTHFDREVFEKCTKLRKFQFSVTSPSEKNHQDRMFLLFAQMVPAMGNLQQLRVEGSRGGHSTALASSLLAWPPQALREIWLTFGLCGTSLDSNGLVLSHADLAVRNLQAIQESQNTQEKVLAFMLAQNSRLGMGSVWHSLDAVVLSIIIDTVMARTAAKASWA